MLYYLVINRVLTPSLFLIIFEFKALKVDAGKKHKIRGYGQEGHFHFGRL